MRLAVSLVLAAGAAYAFSFAADLLLGGLIGVYPGTAFLPAVAWSVLSTIALLAARAVSRGSAWLSLPYVAFGVLAALGGAVGSHPHDFAVAGLMFLHAYLLWRAAPPCLCRGARFKTKLLRILASQSANTGSTHPSKGSPVSGSSRPLYMP